jgi:uncharacterized protein (DUF1697 family)
MNTYISMLRGINVTGHNKISMIELKKFYESLDFQNVVTYIQSGNVIFDSKLKDPSKLSSPIELNLKKTFDLDVSVILRNKNDIQQIIETNPFIKRNEDPSKLHVTFLHAPPSDLHKLSSFTIDSDEFIIVNKEIFLFCTNGYGRTKFTNNFFESKLNLTATTRNWNTVNALYKIAVIDKQNSQIS